MKKISLIFLSFLLLLSLVGPKIEAAPANTICSQYSSVEKVWWNGTELKSGQIGRITVLHETSLFKLIGETRTFIRTLKKGEIYNIYSIKLNMLNVGGGYFVTLDKKVKYDTPSKEKLDAAYCVYTYNPANVSYALNPNKSYVYSLDPKFDILETFSLRSLGSDGVNIWQRSSNSSEAKREKETKEGLFLYSSDKGIAPLQLLSYPIQEGKRWSLWGGAFREIVSANRTVETKAGVFKNVVVVMEYVPFGGRPKKYSIKYEYYAPNIGLIMEQEDSLTNKPWRRIVMIK